jgi:hypothetical protein
MSGRQRGGSRVNTPPPGGAPASAEALAAAAAGDAARALAEESANAVLPPEAVGETISVSLATMLHGLVASAVAEALEQRAQAVPPQSRAGADAALPTPLPPQPAPAEPAARGHGGNAGGLPGLAPDQGVTPFAARLAEVDAHFGITTGARDRASQIGVGLYLAKLQVLRSHHLAPLCVAAKGGPHDSASAEFRIYPDPSPAPHLHALAQRQPAAFLEYKIAQALAMEARTVQAAIQQVLLNSDRFLTDEGCHVMCALNNTANLVATGAEDRSLMIELEARPDRPASFAAIKERYMTKIGINAGGLPADEESALAADIRAAEESFAILKQAQLSKISAQAAAAAELKRGVPKPRQGGGGNQGGDRGAAANAASGSGSSSGGGGGGGGGGRGRGGGGGGGGRGNGGGGGGHQSSSNTEASTRHE